MTSVLLAASITVGSHPQGKLFGLTVNLDTLWATGAAMLVVMVLGLVLRARATSGVPGKLQLVWEAGVGAVQKQVETSIGPRGAAIVPLAVALGAKYEFLPAPTGDINLPLGMALFVIVLVHGASIKSRGPIGYVSHYLFQPFPKFLFPLNLFINVVEEVARPLTLALRLFGNLLSGGLMLALIAALAVWHIAGLPVGYLAVVLFDPAWKLFDVLLIGPIQAFIFSLLTLIYFDVAMQHA
ncbi:MAG: F0F1 ATP synthase subunit A [Acidimicrobiales bacterium]